MNFVIPMAGLGSRFSQAGYRTPKPLLSAHGKTLLQWSVDSLPLNLAQRLIFIGLQKDREVLEPLIRREYASYQPQGAWLGQTTRGQLETVLKARPFWDVSVPLVVFNIDTCFNSPTLEHALANCRSDGVLGAFSSSEPRFSYARLDAAGNVVEVVEKSVISRHALSGLYHFASTRLFEQHAEMMIAQNQTVMGEFYIAPLYNHLIQKGCRFALDPCREIHILGTPEEYESFLKQPPPASTPG